MRHLTLTRISDTGQATFGILTDEEHKQLCVTAERPWLGNQHDVSCVPAGVYLVHRRYSPKHKGDVFELDDVPHRSNIEIHVGNVPRLDSQGCILVGNGFALVNGENGIKESRQAFARFMDALRGVDRFTLTILDAIPPAA